MKVKDSQLNIDKNKRQIGCRPKQPCIEMYARAFWM